MARSPCSRWWLPRHDARRTKQMGAGHMEKRIGRQIIVLLLAPLLVSAALASCDSAPRASQVSAAVSTTDPSPTATATAVQDIWMCAPAASAAAVPVAPRAGWAWYREPHLGFQVPIPPGWQPGTYTDTTPGGPSSFTVQFFPPQTPVAPGPAASAKAPRLIDITLMPAGNFPMVSQDPAWCTEPSPVALGSSQVTVYDRGAPDDRGLLRAIETSFQGYTLLFEMKEAAIRQPWLDPAAVRGDTALYLAMLQGFGPIAG
jgi:hypothetical protein